MKSPHLNFFGAVRSHSFCLIRALGLSFLVDKSLIQCGKSARTEVINARLIEFVHTDPCLVCSLIHHIHQFKQLLYLLVVEELI